MKRNIWICLLCIAFLFMLFDNFSAQEDTRRTRRPSRWKGPEIGKVVKDFSLETVYGENFTLSDCKGKITVFVFGACT